MGGGEKDSAGSTKQIPVKKTEQIYKGSSKKFDLIVIGGGTAGTEIAFEATKAGVKTALVEPNFLGGVCLNTGCIPTKTLLRSAELYSEIQNSSEFGINVSSASVDFAKVMQRAKGIVDASRKGVELGLNNKNLTIFKDHASFVGKKKIKVGAEVIEGSKIIIATGSKPHVPPIPGLNEVDYFVSGTQNNSPEDILNIQQLPQTIVIIGGGYIGFEFATFFYELGSKVIILEGTDSVLRMLDKDVLDILLKRYDPERFSVLTGVKISKVSAEGGNKIIAFTDNQGEQGSVSGDALLVATGRIPSSFELHPSASGIRIGKRGEIIVDDFLETSCKGIYAVGDVTGKVMFAHTAKREGMIAMKNAVSGSKSRKKFNTNAVPWAVFVNPPIAGVGQTGKDAKGAGVLKSYFARAARSGIIGDTKGILKVWFDKKSKKILGAEMIGLNSDDLISEFSALINCGGTVENLREIIHIHPTLSEVVDSLKEEKAVVKKPENKKIGKVGKK